MSAVDKEFLRDVLSRLRGWSREGGELRRTLEIDETQHADLTERIKVVADAMRIRPDIRRRDGLTQIRLSGDADAVTSGEVALAARIEDAYRTVTQPRIPGQPRGS